MGFKILQDLQDFTRFTKRLQKLDSPVFCPHDLKLRELQLSFITNSHLSAGVGMDVIGMIVMVVIVAAVVIGWDGCNDLDGCDGYNG